MKAIISSTYDDKYLFFLPIVTWLWNRLGVDVICFLPYCKDEKLYSRSELAVGSVAVRNKFHYFESPEHKEATYAQCLRNYAACLDLPENEYLISSDVDMALFQIPEYIDNGKFSVFGSDLVPEGQYPQCYITGTVKNWRDAFDLHGITYQQAIDRLLGEDECQNYRGCRWSVDQEQSFLKISPTEPNLIPRARPNTQWAKNRYDRDDYFILDRLSPDTIDYHMNRPGTDLENFEKILTILKYHYPQEQFDWLIKYHSDYSNLL